MYKKKEGEGTFRCTCSGRFWDRNLCNRESTLLVNVRVCRILIKYYKMKVEGGDRGEEGEGRRRRSGEGKIYLVCHWV